MANLKAAEAAVAPPTGANAATQLAYQVHVSDAASATYRRGVGYF